MKEKEKISLQTLNSIMEEHKNNLVKYKDNEIKVKQIEFQIKSIQSVVMDLFVRDLINFDLAE